ncbi:MAG TPA: VOC family protein [Xanthobacteraceae bacterium]|jgi:2,3-dihydroxybiphenyl 1,2-dioxygenase|nr:VOC family protein [Xanthobacteraceae bacterium]
MTVQNAIVQALGYVGVRAGSLEDWAGYGENLLGLQRIDKTRTTMAFRMDDRKQRLLVEADGGQGISVFGWEVADAAALDALAARLEAHGTKVARGSRALADERHVRDLIVANDPAGNRLEFFHGAAVATDPFKPGRNISGFRTGALGMGHVVMHVERLADLMPFYQDVLEFKLSDYWLRPFPGYFFHVNPRHHSFAMMETGKNMVHHMMLELFSLDDVGQGYDLALTDQERIAVSLGRHSGDYVTSFYTWNPSGFMVEYGWGGQVIDDSTWTPFERKHGPSLWGHDRKWMSPEKREESRRLCIETAEAGLRQPVQVIDGNYNRMPGVCPWLDQIKAQKAG